ncbi:MAG: hypothetical protein M1376_20195 [Planctomycetes bacterium]|nr:hypothetical protein [Planctomycetota bacterium]
MTEIEYIESIDACFPYDHEKAWKAVVDEGINISDNAAYMALYRICGPPADLPDSEVRRMLEYWTSKYNHPTKSMMLNAAKAVVHGADLPEEEILRCLDEIATYPGLYNAIGILWQAAPRGGDWPGRATEAVEQKCDEIRKGWEGAVDGST